MYIKTSDPESIKPFLTKLVVPHASSHKGQNGKLLIIGGSTLFHAASLWAAEVASHFADMVHYSSTEENNEVFLSLKKIFRNGIIVRRNDLLDYVKEDDAILIGPGMVRSEEQPSSEPLDSFEDVITLTDEAEYSRQITQYLLKNFPHKKFIIDAGALQMIDKDWLKNHDEKVIITPHQGEFLRLFGEDLTGIDTIEEKAEIVKRYAKEYNCIIMMKAIDDIVTDGDVLFIVQGGNQGLTKGGSGDILAGLTVSLFAKNDPITSCVLASYIEKKAAEEIAVTKGYWYNMSDLILKIPEILLKLHL